MSTLKLLLPCRLHFCPIFSTSVELPFSQHLMHRPLRKGDELSSACRLPADSGGNPCLGQQRQLPFLHLSCSFHVSAAVTFSPIFFILVNLYLKKNPNPQNASCHFSGVSGECLVVCFSAGPGLSCGTGHLFVEAGKLLVAACGISFPDQGSNPGPLHWERGVLATKPPKKSSESVDKCVPSISAENT